METWPISLATGMVKGGVTPPFLDKDIKRQRIKKIQLVYGDVHKFFLLYGLSWWKDTEMAGILEYSHCFSFLTSGNRQHVLFYWGYSLFTVSDVERIMVLKLLSS